jgi:hypothetical protein
MEGIGSADAGRRGPANNPMRSLDFASPEDVEFQSMSARPLWRASGDGGGLDQRTPGAEARPTTPCDSSISPVLRMSNFTRCRPALCGGRLVMEGIGSADAGRRGPANNNMRSLDFACPEDIEGLGMNMGRARSSSLRSHALA